MRLAYAGIYNGNSIAFAIHSLDPAIFSRLIVSHVVDSSSYRRRCITNRETWSLRRSRADIANSSGNDEMSKGPT